MDWKGCIKKNLVKEIKVDENLIKSLINSAKVKIDAEESIPKKFSEPKISLIYDALRMFLEGLALKNKFKIYNHECYVFFLKEILKRSDLASKFDKARKIRNAINYYGKRINEKESKQIIKEIKLLIKELQNLLK
ncbi:MAG: hypothetical protein KJ939_03555 [Nanoarchaeota archaeon]|nr:hypothetical protein [Nanoarchaeota archaeon]MBU4352135.1 hypothetical protein [Nanoarchaeota archaeon]